MCNLYSMMSNQEAIRAFSKFLKIATNAGNLPQIDGVFPDKMAPVVRNTAEGRELAMVRWGLPTPPEKITGNYDKGTTNVRRAWIPHWQQFLEVDNRCVVPVTSFAEPDQASGTKINHWFALGEDRPLFFFAGFWTPQFTSVRAVKEGPTTNDLFAFMTTDANTEVHAIHPKAMPVILRTPEDVDAWMTLPWKEAKKMQKSLPNGTLKIVGRGRKADGPGMPFELPSAEKTPEEPVPAQEPPAQGSLF
jgi:putative SOS response-associated peptidase YedK